MTDARCITEPVSWLRLERYVLEELPAGEREAIARHLRACTACAAAEREARQPLSAGPSAAPAAAATARRQSPPAPLAPLAPLARFAGRLASAVFGSRPAGIASRIALVGATALALSLSHRPPARGPGAEVATSGERVRPPGRASDGTMAGIKGGDVSVELVRERDGDLQSGATTFATGDRWKVLVTCPSGRVQFWDLAVRDEAGTAFPLAPTSPITCGNRVPLPGALRISGARPNDVCLFLTDAPAERARLATRPRERFAADAAACFTLQPEAQPR